MNAANSLPPEKIIDLINQLFEITKSALFLKPKSPSLPSKNWKKKTGLKNKYMKQARFYKVKMWI